MPWWKCKGPDPETASKLIDAVFQQPQVVYREVPAPKPPPEKIVVEKLVSGRDVLFRLLAKCKETTRCIPITNDALERQKIWGAIEDEIYMLLCAPWFTDNQPSYKRPDPAIMELNHAIDSARRAVQDHLYERAIDILSDPYNRRSWGGLGDV